MISFRIDKIEDILNTVFVKEVKCYKSK